MLEIDTGSAPLRRIDLGPEGRFSVSYWHSMYDVPFTEDYIIDADRQIRLDDLHSAGGTVLDYYALEGVPGEVRALNRHFASLAFAVAVKNPQTLIVGARRWSFLEFGESGARLVFTARVDCKPN